MAKSSSSSIPALDGLSVETVEWLPSGAESGLVRVRGRWLDDAARRAELPVLALLAGGEEHRFDSLPDARFSRDPSSWRGTYLVAADLVATDPDALWLEWPDGVRSGLPPLARGVEPPPVPGAPERVEPPEETGGQVIDRAVLAERRARRAEAAEQHQARVAAEALKAVEVLELRSAELERRLEEATAERDSIAARDSGAADRREALAAALASAAALRARSREWQLHLRTSEVARAGDAVRLAVLEADRAAHAPALREALIARTSELEASRRDAATRAGELEAATSDAAAARAAVADGEARLAASEQRREELESELAAVRSELSGAREEAATAVRALEGTLATTEARLRVETVARTTLEDELDRERAHRRAAAAIEEELTEERVATAELRIQVESLRAELTTARTEAATATATDLRAELAAARAEAAHAADLRIALDAARSDAAAAADLRAELDSARGTLADLQTELDAERVARRAAEEALGESNRTGATLQERIVELEASGRAELERLAREQAAAAAAHAPAADSTQVVADLDAAAESLRRRAAPEPAAPDVEPATEAPAWPAAAAPATPAVEPAADLPAPPEPEAIVTAPAGAAPAAPDAEPAAEWTAPATEPCAPDAEPAVEWSDPVDEGEAHAPVVPAAQPRREGADEPDPEWAPPDYVRTESVEPPAPDAEPFVESAPPARPRAEVVSGAETASSAAETVPGGETVSVAPPEPVVSPGPKIVPASGPPPRALMLGTERRHYPLLRGAIVKLAHDDAALAGRVLAALLPAQGAKIDGPLAYDLTILGAGTFAIAIAGGRASAEPIERPRPRHEAEFHLKADPLILAELLAGVEHKIGRFFGPARVRGRKRRVKDLRPLATTPPSLTEAARAGATLDPELVYRTFAYAVHPGWTKGHTFTIAQAIDGDPPETWYLTARNGAGLTVSPAPPATPPRATVSMTRATFDRLLRGEPVPSGERPLVRGDAHAVELMRAWTERAR